MEAKQPLIFIEGVDEIIRRDLEKHKGLLERSQVEKLAYQAARSKIIEKKKHYVGLVGGEKYDDKALKTAIDFMAIDIREMSDKIKLSDDAIDHHTLIVDTLTADLQAYEQNFKEFYRAAGS